jgi:2-octaprenyl-6-methoxyphenol hydroxylase
MSASSFDLIIAGGGLAGGSLACAARQAGQRIAVLESFELDDRRQPSFDERTIALTYASSLVFQGIGIWASIEAQACPIESIHISNRGRFGSARLDHDDAGTPALGYVVPTRVLGGALMQMMKQGEGITLLCPATAQSVEWNDDGVSVRTDDGQQLTAPLLVLADGGRSSLGAQVGLELSTRRYAQSALVTIVGVSRPHGNRAYERFTEHGPLALLPMTGERMAVAWTLAEDEACAMRDADSTEFLCALQETFGDRCGQFSRVGSRHVYPLSLGHLSSPVGKRVVAIGNAAHIVHPVAGQGFNLGLRDVADLTDILVECWNAGEDIGASTMLERYARSRHTQTRRVDAFTDGLISLFTSRIPGVAMARTLGLNLIDLMPASKRFFLDRTMGRHGRLPRLSRGLAPGHRR